MTVKFTVMLTLSAMAAAAGATDWPTINAAAREQAKTPIRAGEPGIRPFWNAYSKAFIHPPAFDFKEIPGAKEYRFTIEGNQEQSNADESAHSENSPHLTHSWLAPHPWLPLDAAAWD